MRGTVGKYTFVSDLSEAALDLDLGSECFERWLVVTQVPQLLLELDGEGNDV
jgi:hypothetical protein